jgi:dienelactone hydrolase
MIHRLLLSALLAPAADPAPADTAAADAAIHKYLVAETNRLSERFLDGATTKAEWEAKRPRLKEQFLDMLGLWPLPERTPLKATVTGTFERGDVVIEKLHYQSRPGLYVTANLYRPKTAGVNPAARLPAILYVCGHSGRGRDGNKTAFQDHGLWFASNGYVCLIVDTLQLGEVAGKHHGTYNLNRFWWQSRGYTPAGVECWNGIRGIDYLCSRPDVDPDRIGVTGISGGGATTVWMAAADDRVKVAVPVSGMSDLESYVSNQVINGHCDCMFAINTYQWEWTTILALFAPKPLLFANSDNDRIFPMDGNRRVITRLRRAYEMLGAPDKVDEYISKGGHEDRPDLRLAAFRFMNKHLKGDTGPVQPAALAPTDGKALRVFPEEKDLPKDAINDRADEVFVPVAEVKLPERREDFAAWKAGLVKQLREKSFRALPDKVPPVKRVSRPETRELVFEAEPGMEMLSTQLHSNGTGKGTFTLVVLNPDETPDKASEEWVKRYPESAVIFATYPRGGGSRRWTRKNPPNTVERSLALLGQTVDSGRVRDILATHTTRPPGREPFPFRLVGSGQAGVIAAYAALLAPGVDEVVILDPPTSHREGPHFLNVMRVLDIPDALGLLAPDVKLTLIGANDKAFDKTAAIYKLAGAEAKFRRE